MIQLNTTSLFGPQDQSNSLLPPSTSQTDDGFQTALSAALSTTLQKFGINPNSVNLSITPAVSATPTTPAAQVASTLPAVTPFSAAANTGDAPVTTTPVTAATTSTTPTTPATGTAASGSSDDSTEAFDNAYWAAQPPAVQALRTMDNYEERTQLASQLSAQGYTIDVPIMVYGWDPAKITAARESYGYTWVPSATQNPIAEAPGISTPGATAYNANNPPAGSIAV